MYTFYIYVTMDRKHMHVNLILTVLVGKLLLQSNAISCIYDLMEGNMIHKHLQFVLSEIQTPHNIDHIMAQVVYVTCLNSHNTIPEVC